MHRCNVHDDRLLVAKHNKRSTSLARECAGTDSEPCSAALFIVARIWLQVLLSLIMLCTMKEL